MKADIDEEKYLIGKLDYSGSNGDFKLSLNNEGKLYIVYPDSTTRDFTKFLNKVSSIKDN